MTTKKSKMREFDFSVLRELRRQRKVTLEQLAEDTGVSFSTLTRIESNQNQPSLATVKTLADFFGMTPAHLVDLASSYIVERRREVDDDPNMIGKRGVSFPDVGLRLNSATAGETVNESHSHENEYQISWVLDGKIALTIEGNRYELAAGDAIKFDATYNHSTQALQDSTFVVALIPKRTK
ncbi:MAG: helix-turn-helix domain-containing protein [Deltaproteobacteria bacterium]|nr:helix-turn-helix domain-containing protein [bacterium]MCB9476495.1 helix-turn-helix domain-containing protein [Deltaproteobacteria bacterium]MCB9478916.1 helix-turn-helix domain-containing protein [Deltaproteobacteria bacterium]MCB9489422.1 helix-turn-helix domain-containing protein [Deltaproteobacteria bacterium]